MKDWTDYFSNETQFACIQHKELSYCSIYRDLMPYVNITDNILDFGCGEGLFSEKLSKHCANVFLYDSSPRILERLHVAIKKNNIKITNNFINLKSIDLVLMSSVSQYVTQAELCEILKNLKECLGSNGKIILSDVIPLKNSILKETLDLFKVSLENKFFLRALLKIFSSFFGEYSTMRSKFPLTKYSPDCVRRISESLGYKCKTKNTNIGLNPNRLTFILQKI